jgi:2-amino-4-hydroxy-6-hydroxymethyldihydropteridine diphosphokinase/dihydropteroate synthase
MPLVTHTAALWQARGGDAGRLGGEGIKRVVPVGGEGFWEMGRRTFIMGVLNVDPDSFSGDGISSVEAAVATAQQMALDGADIIDVGGQSTRPHAPRMSPQEELDRVLPFIKALAAAFEGTSTLISIDTFNASVAREAVHAGAHIVNDVSGGTLDSDMMPTVGCYVYVTPPVTACYIYVTPPGGHAAGGGAVYSDAHAR